MESARSSGKMKASKVKAANENASPLQMEMDDQRGRYLQSMTMSPRFQPFAENIDVGSPLARYLFTGSPISGKVVSAGDAFSSPTFGSSKYRSAKSQQYSGSSSGNSSSFGPRGRLSLSPLSSVENLEMAQLKSPPMYGTPVKVDEEVLVMDDILVRSTPGGGKSGRSSSSSSGRGSSSSSSSSQWLKSVLKTEVCRAWDESGNCRNNSKSQFTHGKEENHPTRFSMKSKSEAQTGKSPLSAGSGIYGSNSHTVYQHQAAAESLVTKSQPASPAKPEPHSPTLAPAIPNTSSDWSPLDDGIEVVLPNGSNKAPSREEVDSHISSLLLGSTAKQRLPVFVKLCEVHDPVVDNKPPNLLTG